MGAKDGHLLDSAVDGERPKGKIVFRWDITGMDPRLRVFTPLVAVAAGLFFIWSCVYFANHSYMHGYEFSRGAVRLASFLVPVIILLAMFLSIFGSICEWSPVLITDTQIHCEKFACARKNLNILRLICLAIGICLFYVALISEDYVWILFCVVLFIAVLRQKKIPVVSSTQFKDIGRIICDEKASAFTVESEGQKKYQFRCPYESFPQIFEYLRTKIPKGRFVAAKGIESRLRARKGA